MLLCRRVSFVLLIFMSMVCGPKPGPEEVSGPPEWVINPPQNPNYLYVIGIATSWDLSLAHYRARLEARQELNGYIEGWLRGMLCRIAEEEGCGDMDFGDMDFIAPVAPDNPIDQIILRLFPPPPLSSPLPPLGQVVKQSVCREGRRWRVYVLMEIPVREIYKEVYKALNTVIEPDNRRIYQRFLRELEEKLEFLQNYAPKRPLKR